MDNSSLWPSLPPSIEPFDSLLSPGKSQHQSFLQHLSIILPVNWCFIQVHSQYKYVSCFFLSLSVLNNGFVQICLYVFCIFSVLVSFFFFFFIFFYFFLFFFFFFLFFLFFSFFSVLFFSCFFFHVFSFFSLVFFFFFFSFFCTFYHLAKPYRSDPPLI